MAAESQRMFDALIDTWKEYTYSVRAYATSFVMDAAAENSNGPTVVCDLLAEKDSVKRNKNVFRIFVDVVDSWVMPEGMSFSHS